MNSEEEAAAQVEESVDASRDEFLLVEITGRRAAVPLADVLRIEQLPHSRIEYVGYRPVLNFEGHLLPVEDTGGILGQAAEVESAASGADAVQIIVVVCRDGSRQVGIVVSHVLDVAAGSDLFEAGTGARTGSVTMLKNRVTGVVDLGSVAPLVQGEPAHDSWTPTAEVMG